MTEQNGIEDQRVVRYNPLISPYQLKTDIPRSDLAADTVRNGRKGIENILDRTDPRILVIAGPCSIHDTEAAMEYANKLRPVSEAVSDQFLVVMRTYFEKPRTSLGWKGFIYDPDLNGSDDMNKGLHLSRGLLRDVSELGLPTATEYLESTAIPQHTSDFISWGVVGARTAYSQPHREMASGLSMPIGIKNDTHGDISVAINGVLFARAPQSFIGATDEGTLAVVKTTGNPYAHIVLRGGDDGPNYDAKSVQEAQAKLIEAGLRPNVVIDSSHANSNKDHRQQPIVFEEVVRQIKDGNDGIVGIMLESNLEPSNQLIPTDLTGFDSNTLEYGLSVTDACVGWEDTERLLLEAYKTLTTKKIHVS